MIPSPGSFAELIGQARPAAVLRNAVRRDRVAHAYLFHGPEGVGKSTAARLFAQALNCERRAPEEGDGCGECRSCELIAEGSHPDVRLLAPEREGETAVIPIEAIRRGLVYDVHLRPVMGRYKVYVLDPADRTAPLAIHTVLKVLEEPPPHVVVVLVTARPGWLPSTILSRCQPVAFQLAGAESIWRHLERHGIEGGTARLLATLSGGRPGWAIRAAGQPQLLEARQRLLNLCAEIEARPPAAALRLAEQIREEAARVAASAVAPDAGEEEGEAEPAEDTAGAGGREVRAAVPWCLEVMATWYRDRVAAATGGRLLNEDQAPPQDRDSARVVAEAGRAIEAILAARREIARNANVDLALEALAVQLIGDGP